ncbi:MAG: hypothetical protein JNM09_24185 [Blastocatellia bacterium]|nr:hypothetical protein [Blastocatellia bacterium]
MTGCEPAVGYAPEGWSKTDHTTWAKNYEEFRIEISEIGGMLHHEYSNSLITLTPKVDTDILIKSVILKTSDQTYSASLEKRNLYRVNEKVTDTAVIWTFNKRLPDVFRPPLEIQITLLVGSQEKSLVSPLSKVFGF